MVKVKVKVTFNLEQSMKALRGSTGNSSVSLTLALSGEYIQRDTPDAILPGETEIGWATRTVWTGAGNLAPQPGFNHLTVHSAVSH